MAYGGVVTLDMGPNYDEIAGPLGAVSEAQKAQGIAIKKAGACGIEFHDQPGPGQGVLKWFLGPRALQRLAQTRKGNA